MLFLCGWLSDFTNGAEDDITEESFIKSVKSLNKEIYDSEQELLSKGIEENSILPHDYATLQMIMVCKFTMLKLKIQKVYFLQFPMRKNILENYTWKIFSRETSNMGFDISTIFLMQKCRWYQIEQTRFLMRLIEKLI